MRANASGAVFLKRLAADREKQGTLTAALTALSEKLDETEDDAGMDAGADAGAAAAAGARRTPDDGAIPSLVRIRLTEKAKPVEQAIERAEEDARTQCLEGLEPAEQAQLAELLARVTTNAKAPFSR